MMARGDPPLLQRTAAIARLPAAPVERASPAGLPAPAVHSRVLRGPARSPTDVSTALSASDAWASGGLVSDPVGPEPVHPRLRRRQAVRRAPRTPADSLRHRTLRADRPGGQQRRAGDLPLPDALRHGVRAHGQLRRLHAVHGGHAQWGTLGHRLGKHAARPDSPRRSTRRAFAALHRVFTLAVCAALPRTVERLGALRAVGGEPSAESRALRVTSRTPGLLC